MGCKLSPCYVLTNPSDNQPTIFISLHFSGYGTGGEVNNTSGSGSGEDDRDLDIKYDFSIFTTTTLPSFIPISMQEHGKVMSSDGDNFSGSGDSDYYKRNTNMSKGDKHKSFDDISISGSGNGDHYVESGYGEIVSMWETSLRPSSDTKDEPSGDKPSFVSSAGEDVESGHDIKFQGLPEVKMNSEMELEMSFSGSGERKVPQKEQDRDLNFETTPMPLSPTATSARKVLRTLSSRQSTSARNLQRTVDILTGAPTSFPRTSATSPTAAAKILESQANPGMVMNNHENVNIHEDVNIHEEHTSSKSNNVSTKFEWIVAKSNFKVKSSDLMLILGDGFMLDVSSPVKTTHGNEGSSGRLNLLEFLQKFTKELSKGTSPAGTHPGTTQKTPTSSPHGTMQVIPSTLGTVISKDTTERYFTSNSKRVTQGDPTTTPQRIASTIAPQHTSHRTGVNSPQESPDSATTPPSPFTMVTFTKDTLDNSIDPVLSSTKQPQLAVSSVPPFFTSTTNNGAWTPSHKNVKDGYGNSLSNTVEVTESSQVKGHTGDSENNIDNEMNEITVTSVKSEQLKPINVTNNSVEMTKEVKVHEEVTKGEGVNEKKDQAGAKKFRKRKIRKRPVKRKNNHVDEFAVIIEGSGMNVKGQSSNSKPIIHVETNNDLIVDQVFPV